MTKTRFNWHSIKQRRNKIASYLGRNYVGQPVVGTAVPEIANFLMTVVPPDAAPSAVYETVRLLAGETLTTTGANEFAWRIAGNLPTLVSGEPVVPWNGQLRDEIMPIRVESVFFTRRRNDSGFIFRCRAQAGSFCPGVFSHFLSSRSCSAISHAVGFSHNSWGPYPYAGVADHFVNMVFFAHIVAERSRDQPWFREVSASSSMLKANKELLAVRCRTRPCPLNYTHSCASCPVGYIDCGYAVHKTTYVQQHCRSCSKESFFDLSVDVTNCLSCYKRMSISCS
jgi:hypothetical protein